MAVNDDLEEKITDAEREVLQLLLVEGEDKEQLREEVAKISEELTELGEFHCSYQDAPDYSWMQSQDCLKMLSDSDQMKSVNLRDLIRGWHRIGRAKKCLPQLKKKAQAAETERLEKAAQAERLEKEAQAERLEKEAQAERLQKEAQAERLEKEAQAERLEKEAQAERLEKEALAERLQNEAQAETERLEKEAQAERLEEKAQAERLERQLEKERADGSCTSISGFLSPYFDCCWSRQAGVAGEEAEKSVSARTVGPPLYTASEEAGRASLKEVRTVLRRTVEDAPIGTDGDISEKTTECDSADARLADSMDAGFLAMKGELRELRDEQRALRRMMEERFEMLTGKRRSACGEAMGERDPSAVERRGQSNAEMSGNHGDVVAEALGDAGEQELPARTA